MVGELETIYVIMILQAIAFTVLTAYYYLVRLGIEREKRDLEREKVAIEREKLRMRRTNPNQDW